LSASPPPVFVAQNLRVQHGWFGREGGVSTGIYASLNAGTGSDDDPTAVAENRRRIAGAMGVETAHLAGVHQVHSATALCIEGPWTVERPPADGLVTTTLGLALSVLTADCAPVLLADADAGVIGAAHAGWRGALGGILQTTVRLMEMYGASRITAAIGPCIHQASYEVGPEFEAQFLGEDASHARFFAPGAGDRRMFDLPGFCADRLRAAGVDDVAIAPQDTYTAETQLFSHRRGVHRGEAGYGRNCAAIVL
jgi:YfiH family protein